MKAFWIFCAVLLVLSTIIGLVVHPSAGVAFHLGRALATVLLPATITLAIAGLYRLIRKKAMPGKAILLCALWLPLTLLAAFGNLLEAVERTQ